MSNFSVREWRLSARAALDLCLSAGGFASYPAPKSAEAALVGRVVASSGEGPWPPLACLLLQLVVHREPAVSPASLCFANQRLSPNALPQMLTLRRASSRVSSSFRRTICHEGLIESLPSAATTSSPRSQTTWSLKMLGWYLAAPLLPPLLRYLAQIISQCTTTRRCLWRSCYDDAGVCDRTRVRLI